LLFIFTFGISAGGVFCAGFDSDKDKLDGQKDGKKKLGMETCYSSLLRKPTNLRTSFATQFAIEESGMEAVLLMDSEADSAYQTGRGGRGGLVDYWSSLVFLKARRWKSWPRAGMYSIWFRTAKTTKRTTSTVLPRSL